MLQIKHNSVGRALAVTADGSLYAGRGYHIYRSQDDGRSWSFVTRMPAGFVRSVAGAFRLGARLLRHEVRALATMSDGSLLAANREWVYRASPNQSCMERARVEEAGQPLSPPMTLTVGPGDRVLFGEYDSSFQHGKPVRVFVSDDGGRSYQVARVFEARSMLHIHNLIYDPTLRKYWLLSGDHHHEPGIGLLSEDLQSFDWLVKGEQRYRAVDLFDFGDRLVYGIDSEKEANAIVSLEKASGRIDRLVEIEGSCIYSAKFGRWYVLSTTVEPSEVNHSRFATLWLSSNGADWKRVFAAEKDRWEPRYFQYGSLVLPRGASSRDAIHFSGQALKGLDARICSATWTAD